MQQQAQRTAPKTILIIDNDKAFLKGKSELLEMVGYNVLTATTTAEAREIIQDQRPDLVLLDVRLIDDNEPKDESGLGFAYYLRDHGIPSIIITAYSTPEIARQTLGSDDHDRPLALDFLGKTESNKKLIQTIEKALENAQTQQEKSEEPPLGSSWAIYKEAILSTSSLFVSLLSFFDFLFRKKYATLAISAFSALIFIIFSFALLLKDTSEHQKLAEIKKITLMAILITLLCFLLLAVYLFW